MKERPMLFSPVMSKAIRDGQKTMTRRITDPQPEPSRTKDGCGWCWYGWGRDNQYAWNTTPETLADQMKSYCPYGKVGDRLEVVELRPIPISPNDDYMAGSDGEVYSRTHYAGFGRKDYVEWYPLKGHPTKKGYRTVSLCHQNKKVTKNIHRLICWAFYGAPPHKSSQVRHLDGDGSNNRPENLCWGTQAENWLDRKAHGNGCAGEKHHAAKFSNLERDHIRWAISSGLCSQKHVARVLNVSPTSISQILNAAELKKVDPPMPVPYQPITLEITGIRVERLQEISAADVIAEGVSIPVTTADCAPGKARPLIRVSGKYPTSSYLPDRPTEADFYRAEFASLWDRINGKTHPWSMDPWVWVVSFKPVEMNDGNS